MWINILYNPKYIGSSRDLSKRFREYFSIKSLKRSKSMYISRALLKHDYSNFFLTILENCKVSKLLTKEKYFWKLLKPEYNIVKNPTAPPMSGRKHSPKTITIISDKKKG
jgi:group I intron endonuclease